MSSKTEETGEKQIRAKASPKAKESAAKKSSTSAKSKAASTKKTASIKSKAASGKKKAPASKAEAPSTKTRKAKAKETAESAANNKAGSAFVDPIGDVSDGEAQFAAGTEVHPEAQAQMDAYRAETEGKSPAS